MKRAGLLFAALGWGIYFVGLIPAIRALAELGPPALDLASLSENIIHLGYVLLLCGVLKAGLESLARTQSAALRAAIAVRAEARDGASPGFEAATYRMPLQERGTIGGQHYIAHPDGSVDLQTKSGWRRFSSVEAALTYMMRADLAA
jgi:hypothetical protein